MVFFGYQSSHSDENHEHQVYHNKIWEYLRAKASNLKCSFRRIKTKGKVVIKWAEKWWIDYKDQKGWVIKENWCFIRWITNNGPVEKTKEAKEKAIRQMKCSCFK